MEIERIHKERILSFEEFSSQGGIAPFPLIESIQSDSVADYLGWLCDNTDRILLLLRGKYREGSLETQEIKKALFDLAFHYSDDEFLTRLFLSPDGKVETEALTQFANENPELCDPDMLRLIVARFDLLQWINKQYDKITQPDEVM